MVKIGILCYGSIFIFRDHLKQAIMTHPLFTPEDPLSPPIFDIFATNFVTTGKKSKQQEVIRLMKLIYDGTPKSYPNGYMMLFVPIQDITNSTPAFRAKIVFNHKKIIGNEALFSIGGLNDLNTLVTLKNGKRLQSILYSKASQLLKVCHAPKSSNKSNQTLEQLSQSLPTKPRTMTR
jgi:hypothetical protein